jgi:hypothetical protein
MPIPHTGKSRDHVKHAAHASDDRGLAATHGAGAFRACEFLGAEEADATIAQQTAAAFAQRLLT